MEQKKTEELFLERIVDILLINRATNGAYEHLLQKEIHYGKHRFEPEILNTLLAKAALRVFKRENRSST